MDQPRVALSLWGVTSLAPSPNFSAESFTEESSLLFHREGK